MIAYLVITLYFAYPPSILELPVKAYPIEKCLYLGAIAAEWLTQPDVHVEWKCVKQESPSKP